MARTEPVERTTAVYVRGALFGLAAVSIWAGNIVVAGLGLRSSLTPWDIAAIRFGVAGLVLLPFLTRTGLALDRLGWIGLTALVLGGAPTVLLVNAGLLFAPASHAGALFPGVMPLMVAVIAAAVLKEEFTLQRKVGQGPSASDYRLDTAQLGIAACCGYGTWRCASGTLRSKRPTLEGRDLTWPMRPVHFGGGMQLAHGLRITSFAGAARIPRQPGRCRPGCPPE